MARPYRPANGEEGEWFMTRFCYRCAKDKGDEQGCKIIAASMCFDADEAEYPKELIYNDKGHPTCTAFASASHGATLPKALRIEDHPDQTFLFGDPRKEASQ